MGFLPLSDLSLSFSPVSLIFLTGICYWSFVTPVQCWWLQKNKRTEILWCCAASGAICFLSTKNKWRSIWSHSRCVFSRTTAGTGETRRVSRSVERNDATTPNKTWSTSSHTKRDVKDRLPGTFVTEVIHLNILPLFHPTLNFVHTLKSFGLDASVYPHIYFKADQRRIPHLYQCWELSGSRSHTLGFILIRQTTESATGTGTVVFPIYQQTE